MPGGLRRGIERVQALVAVVRDRAERTLLWRVWERALENEFIDRSVALGAKAFVSLFPSLLVVAAFTPSSVQHSILTSVANRAGLSGSGLDTVRGAFKSSSDIRRATGILGLLLTFFYVNSFTGALRRVYTRAWRRPPAGQVSGYAIGASWLLGLAVYSALLGLIRGIFGGGPGTILFGVFTWAGSVGLWWLTAWFMLQRQVRWRALATTAVITGTGLVFYALSAAVWMPRMMKSNQQQFGFFGVTLALVSWLTGASVIIVASACAGPVFAEDTGAIGCLACGGDGSLLVEGAAESLAAPLRAPTLSDAIGLHEE